MREGFEQLMWMAAKSDPKNSALWLPFWLHAKDTAGIMEKLWQEWLPDSVRRILRGSHSEEDMCRLCRLLGLLHDAGKLTVSFQRRILPALPDIYERQIQAGLRINLSLKEVKNLHHTETGEAILLSRGFSPGVAAVVGAHHGKSVEGIKKIGRGEGFWDESALRKPMESMWDAWISYSLEMCGYSFAEEVGDLTEKEQVLLTGLLIMADWIASNTAFFPLIQTDEYGKEDGCKARIEKAWARFDPPFFWTVNFYQMTDAVFKSRFGFDMNPVQKAMIQAVSETEKPGIFILEAQMGVGKTEAALAAAEVLVRKTGCGGMFFGLPTQGTANGIFERLYDWAETQAEDQRLAIRLAHGAAEMNPFYHQLLEGQAQVGDEEDAGLVVHDWFQGRKQALLSNFVIGTVDQVLMAALKQKHVMLRHLGLAGKVTILDECHAYDAYMNQYMDMAIRWLGAYGVPVIILSATLPAKRRTELVNTYLGRETKALPEKDVEEGVSWKWSRKYPLLTWTDGEEVKQTGIETDGVSRTVMIKRIGDMERLSVIREAARAGGCIGIIVNTVRRAQELFDELQEAFSGEEADITLFHAQYLLPDKEKIESALLACLGKKSGSQNRRKRIVIGTQVLEQSLDIDFDVLITDLCPMDLLLQRIGRLWRHQGRQRPESISKPICYVVCRDGGELEGGARAIYGEWLLKRTEVLLPENIVLPDDIPDLVQDVYDEDLPTQEETNDYLAMKKEYQKRRQDLEAKAKKYRLEPPLSDEEDPSLAVIKDLLKGVPSNLSDVKARAAVRAGDASIEVIVLQKRGGDICFLPWQHEGASVQANAEPSKEECRQIIKQRIKLPAVFGKDYLAETVIAELEDVKNRYFPTWNQSGMLEGELILLLDEEFRTVLGGYDVRYTREKGLEYTKAEN